MYHGLLVLYPRFVVLVDLLERNLVLFYGVLFVSTLLAVPEIEIEAVLGGRAELPLSLLPVQRDDSVHMIFWFRADFGKPIYR